MSVQTIKRRTYFQSMHYTTPKSALKPQRKTKTRHLQTKTRQCASISPSGLEFLRLGIWWVAPTTLEVPRKMSGVFVAERRPGLLHGTTVPQQFNRLLHPFFKQPLMRTFTHCFMEIPFQCPQRHSAMLRQQRSGPVCLPCQLQPTKPQVPPEISPFGRADSKVQQTVQPPPQFGTKRETKVRLWDRRCSKPARRQSCR